MNILDYDGVSIAVTRLEVETEEYGDTLYVIKEGDILGFTFSSENSIEEYLPDDEINKNKFVVFINDSVESLTLGALDFIKCFDILAVSADLDEDDAFELSKLEYISEINQGLAIEETTLGKYATDNGHLEHYWIELEKGGTEEEVEKRFMEAVEKKEAELEGKAMANRARLDKELSNISIRNAIDKALDAKDYTLCEKLYKMLDE